MGKKRGSDCNNFGFEKANSLLNLDCFPERRIELNIPEEKAKIIIYAKRMGRNSEVMAWVTEESLIPDLKNREKLNLHHSKPRRGEDKSSREPVGVVNGGA